MISSSELIQKLQSYLSNVDSNLIRKAYIFAMEAHGMQKRSSGAPYFYHPTEVAKILADWHMDAQTVITGLLHDVIEDTNVGFEEIEEIFGSEIAFLVEGVTKLSRIGYTSEKVKQADNFRKFMVAISHDIRVLIVKLADRMHNVRTLHYIHPTSKRKRIALETLELYAPLAARIGMNQVKDEMEDIAFYNVYPDEYSIIRARLAQINSHENNFIQNTILELRRLFSAEGLDAEINGRQKSPYSIWRKMQRRNVPLDRINDIMAFRVIVETVKECYIALGIIHTNFLIMPGRFKDYISIPKLNGYKSLHTIVIGPTNLPMEVQIRTKDMHKVANEGIAAHWSYKTGDVMAKLSDTQNYNWINSLLTILQNDGNSEEAVNNSKLEIFNDEVFCFTNNGDLITLPRGATAVDFAYEIHTQIGNTCVGVRINDKNEPLYTMLKNGDRVQIITSEFAHPDASWEKFVVTGKAKSCIKRFIKSREMTEFTTLGLQILKYVFNTNNSESFESKIDLKRFGYATWGQFYYNVGKGIVPLQNIQKLCENKIQENSAPISLIDFSPGIAIHFANCCHPVMGNDIVGVVTPNLGIVIHTKNCDSIKGKDVVDVKWSKMPKASDEISAKLAIVFLNKPEIYPVIINVISSNCIEVLHIQTSRRVSNFTDLTVEMKVRSTQKLGEIIVTLRSYKNIKSVTRL